MPTSTVNAVAAASFAAFSANARSRSQIATFAPEARNRSTMARPMPCAPPVTTALRPPRSIVLLMCRLLHAGYKSIALLASDENADAQCNTALSHRLGSCKHCRRGACGGRPALLKACEPKHRLLRLRRGLNAVCELFDLTPRCLERAGDAGRALDRRRAQA